ncbi:N-acetyltransferase [Candidatus Thorarchaeota archaeon]|nr:MAG: N-acetyltransferase [Candidatus Thorarchaeota archaeon]
MMICTRMYIRHEMKIRRATRADSEWILHHRIEMFKDMGEPEEALKELSKFTEQYLQDDWTKDYAYFLVEDDSKVIGGCGISTFSIPPPLSQPNGSYTYLSNMFVEPEYRRNHVGKMLIDYVVDFCKSEGIMLVILHASDKGLSLYKSLGFTSSERLMHLRTSDYSK